MIDLLTKYQSKEILICVCKSLQSLIFEEQLVLPNNVLDVIEKLRQIYPQQQPIEEVALFFEEINKYTNINNIVKKDKENNFNVPVDIELMNLINEVRKFFS
jgi:molybdopterin converting factor small subunit